MPYYREKGHKIFYKKRLLKHKYFADFDIDDCIIPEIQVSENSINDEVITQTLNYLKVSGCKTGLIINFGRKSLEYKRIIL